MSAELTTRELAALKHLAQRPDGSYAFDVAQVFLDKGITTPHRSSTGKYVQDYHNLPTPGACRRFGPNSDPRVGGKPVNKGDSLLDTRNHNPKVLGSSPSSGIPNRPCLLGMGDIRLSPCSVPESPSVSSFGPMSYPRETGLAGPRKGDDEDESQRLSDP